MSFEVSVVGSYNCTSERANEKESKEYYGVRLELLLVS
jgi:hypothetical protein